MDDQNSNQSNVPVNPPASSQSGADSSNSEADDIAAAVKKEALAALVPLVDSLQGTPEHKFELLMNALQASPDPKLLQKALAAALQIEDPSFKAEALVDVMRQAGY